MTTATPNLGLARAYETICYLALGAVFLAHLQQDLLMEALPALVYGFLGVRFRQKRAPLIYLLLVAGAPFVRQSVFEMSSESRLLNVQDVTLCIGVLGYVSAHYRLQAIWDNLLVLDPRRRRGPARRTLLGFRGAQPIQTVTRPGTHVSREEISSLVLSLPVWALAAQGMLAFASEEWDILDLAPGILRLLLPLWALALGLIVIRSLLEVWKWRHLSPEAAQMFLQDTLWRETRRDQRRLERWVAWQRISLR